MAYIVPSDLTRLALSGAHQNELATLQNLKKELPQDFTVFHGVHWSREYEAWNHFGEIDFVIINKSGDILFIEQKNGKLDETSEGLVKRYGTDQKNVTQQIHRSIDKVREKFKWTHGKDQRLTVDFLIYCPDYRVKQINAAGLSAKRIVDSSTRKDLAKRIKIILGSGVSTNDGWYEKIEDFFYQTFDLVPDIHTHIGSQDKQFVRQSGALADILTNLQMEPFRLRIMGTAGCGKSIFARRFIDREVSAGHKVLLVCYNRPLADLLKQSVGEVGTVNTFYGFCDDFLCSVGQHLDYSLMNSDPDFWKSVLEEVMVQNIDNDCKYDSLIVDEGQDFEQDWYEILRLFLRDGANVLWLEDADQNLQEKPTVTLDGFVGYQSAINYRSPETISRFIKNTLPVSFEQGNDLPGLEVVVHSYENNSEQPKIAGKIVQKLIRQGFSPDDIVIVTCRGARSSIFSNLDQVGSIPLMNFTGEYDSDGQQIMTDGRLSFDSVYRFKGQESPAVIMVDVDPDNDHQIRAERLLYCGMTRATIRLELVVNSKNEKNQIFLNEVD